MKYGCPSFKELERAFIKDMEEQNPDDLIKKYLDRYSSVFNMDNAHSIEIKVGDVFFRGRKGCLQIPISIDDFDTITNYPFYSMDISAPPSILASSGRFNRDGYSYLYLASDVETCVSEIHLEVKQVCSVANFKCKNGGKYFRMIPDPCYFDEFDMLIYEILTQPIHSEIKYKYRMTQFFADIIKQQGYRGIYFKSTQSEGENIVCFYPNDFEYIPFSERIVTATKIQYSIEVLDEEYKQYPDYRKYMMSNSSLDEIVENHVEHILNRTKYEDAKELIKRDKA